MFKSSLSLIKLAPVLMLLAGLGFIGLFMLRSIPVATQAFFTRVEHPVDYSFKSYDKLLKKYVRDGLVDYRELKNSELMKSSLKELAQTAPDKLGPEAKACYWINANNLLTLKIIADRYPIKTLKEIGLDRASRKFVVGGQATSVQKLYGTQLMSSIRERVIPPASVFLIFGGTIGYPPLTEHAITPANLQADGKVAAYRYITNKKNVFFNQETGVFYISSLLNRYAFKFEQAGHDPFSFATLYIAPDKCPDLTDVMLTKTYYPRIDYRINSQEGFNNSHKKAPQDEKPQKQNP